MDNSTKQLMSALAQSGAAGVKEVFRAQLEQALNNLLKAELAGFLGYDSYERCGFNSGDSRNGIYTRKFATAYGSLNLEIPRDRQGNFKQQTLPAYARRSDRLEETVIQLYAHGVTTTEISQLVKTMYDQYYVPATVSNITKSTLAAVEQFHQRKLQDKYFCIFLDATYLNLRRNQVQPEAVSIALGIKPDGHKEVLDYRIAPNESMTTWDELLRNLYDRGLKQVQLFIADGVIGLALEVKRVYPMASFQRCHVHVMRNLRNKVRKHDQAAVLNDFKQLHHAPNLPEARAILRHFYAKWGKQYPRVIQQLTKIETELLAFMKFPPQIRIALYSTNQIESFNKRLKRKTKAKEQFPTAESLDNFVGQQVLSYNQSASARRIARGFSGILDTIESYFD